MTLYTFADGKIPSDWTVTQRTGGTASIDAMALFTGYQNYPSDTNVLALHGNRTDNSFAGVTISVTLLEAGALSFFEAVSSEGNYDLGVLQIDGATQLSVSGNAGWTLRTFPLAAGAHTIDLLFHQDSSVSTGDEVWGISHLEITNAAATAPTEPTEPTEPTAPQGPAFAPDSTLDFEDGNIPSYFHTSGSVYGGYATGDWGAGGAGSKAVLLFVNAT